MITASPKSVFGFCDTARGIARLFGFFLIFLLIIPIQAYRAYSSRGNLYTFARLFHASVARLLGFHIRMHGKLAADGPVLFVANHTSYLDIPVLGSVIPASFVAKAEVAGWPLFGFLAKLQHTAFIERRAVRAAQQRDSLRQRLAEGQSLILFPEGTSSDGQRTLPFKTSLFSLAEAKTPDGRFVKVQPISALCTEFGGLPIGRDERPYFAWYGDMTMAGHLWNVFKFGRFTVDIIFHDPVTIDNFTDRKALAAYCRTKIAEGVERCVTGRLGVRG